MEKYDRSVLDRVRSAIHGMAVGKGDLRERLLSAFIQLAPLRKESFPLELQDDFEWIIKTLTSEEDNTGEGIAKATIAVLEEKIVEDIAHKIISLKDNLLVYEDGLEE